MSNFSELKDFFVELVTQTHFYNPYTRLVKVYNPAAVTYEDYKNTLLAKSPSGHHICYYMTLSDSRKDIDGWLLWTEKEFQQAKRIQPYLEGCV